MKELNYHRPKYNQVKGETDEEYNKRLSRIIEKREFEKEMDRVMLNAKLMMIPLKEKFKKEEKDCEERFKLISHLDYLGYLY